MPFIIKVIEWISGHIHNIELRQNTSFEQCLKIIKFEMEITQCSDLSMFALFPPRFQLQSKERVTEDNYLKIIHDYRMKNRSMKLYVITQKDSPTSSPQNNNAIEVKSATSGSSDRTGQTDFNDRVLTRDNDECLLSKLYH